MPSSSPSFHSTLAPSMSPSAMPSGKSGKSTSRSSSRSLLWSAALSVSVSDLRYLVIRPFLEPLPWKWKSKLPFIRVRVRHHRVQRVERLKHRPRGARHPPSPTYMGPSRSTQQGSSDTCLSHLAGGLSTPSEEDSHFERRPYVWRT